MPVELLFQPPPIFIFSADSTAVMPYTEPSSPVGQDRASAPRPGPSRRPHMSPSHSHHFTPDPHRPAVTSSFSSTSSDPFWSSPANQPMPGLPRRTPSGGAGSATAQRRHVSPPMPGSRTSVTFPSSRPMEALPRRSPSALGSSVGESVGVKQQPIGRPSIHPNPRENKESVSSTSTIESLAPETPTDEIPLDDKLVLDKVCFPTYERHKGIVKNQASPVDTPVVSPATQDPPLEFDFKPIQQRRGRGTLGNGAQHLHHRPQAASLDQHSVQQTASSSSLMMQTGSWNDLGGSSPVRPSSVRKKSGELVKPSLKQRSLSTPDLPLRLAPSEPSTPEAGNSSRDLHGESKSVRFAGSDDTDGRRLENVVLFLREQKVTAVSRAADPNAEGQTETETDTDGSEFVHFRTRRNAAAQAVDEAERISFAEGGSRVPRCRVDFAPDARRSLAGENVVLERVELQQALGPLQFKGSVLVRNVAFQKWVAVRFTMDHWQTVSEVSGAHVCHIPSATTGDEGWDRFSFAIKLEDFKHKLDERQLLICVRFSIEGREWWDSNTNGENYRFTFKKVNPRKEREHRQRPRPQQSQSFQGNYLRLNEPAGMLRTTPNPNSLAASSHAFDPKASPQSQRGPAAWTFPVRLNAQEPVQRSASPIQSPPPPAAFMPPAPPDTHTHLQLSKYCAPSPPQSPPQQMQPMIMPTNEEAARLKRPNMELFAGQYATLAPPKASGHEKRRSWNGNEDWEREREDENGGDETPKAVMVEESPLGVIGHLDLASEESDAASPVESPPRPLLKRGSTPDLRKLVDKEDTGLITPPASNLSSPPTPTRSPLPSPSLSTGESSPIESLRTQDSVDFDNIIVDPNERGRRLMADGKKNLSGSADSSYDDFVARFCFYQPQNAADGAPFSTAQASPNVGFPFFNDINSARNTPTPTGNYANPDEAFGFGALTPNTSAPNKAGFSWGETRHPNDGSPSLSSSATF